MKLIYLYITLSVLTLVMFSCSPDTTAPKEQSSIDSQELISCSPVTFSDFTTISYNVKTGQTVTVSITNISGQIIKVLTNSEARTGNHSITWNGTDAHGNKVSSGVYCYRMDTGRYSVSRKMIYIRH